ncbi:Flp family type IVb pilin [Caulobacter sp. D4A]|uniref:Flp family type IVb pilin n=1 Tax=unclassified Caulobacter TaxID=2648921 RepID=UPI000D739F33|nr:MULTISPECIES: Flp family type IVb pilin [unclassified Caulobacter]PXA87040.1 Flp family type IVb pilin [Caulobacter sp. D5]PXA88249.1 Flp family type IVb pilin [Caulobacter sp. D4A]
MVVFCERFLKDSRGATSIEYGLIAALISVVVLAAVQLLVPAIAGAFGQAETQLRAVAQ